MAVGWLGIGLYEKAIRCSDFSSGECRLSAPTPVAGKGLSRRVTGREYCGLAGQTRKWLTIICN